MFRINPLFTKRFFSLGPQLKKQNTFKGNSEVLNSNSQTGSHDEEVDSTLLLNKSEISKYFDISYARSSGAGGQHVNTTDSKAVLKLSASSWFAARNKWIPAKYFDNLMKNLNDSSAPIHKKFPFFTQSGDILVMSSNTRYRDKNLNECFDKFIEAIHICSQGKKEITQDTKQRWDKLKRKENETRLKDKKLKKDKKSSRRKVNLSDY